MGQGNNRTDRWGEEIRLKPRKDRTGEWEKRGEARAAVLSQAAGLAKPPWLIQRALGKSREGLKIAWSSPIPLTLYGQDLHWSQSQSLP